MYHKNNNKVLRAQEQCIVGIICGHSHVVN